MNDEILARYKYFLKFGKIDDVSQMERLLKFVQEYSSNNGKFFCRHKWKQFSIEPLGWQSFSDEIFYVRCENCGKIDYRRGYEVDCDPRLTDHSRHVFYM